MRSIIVSVLLLLVSVVVSFAQDTTRLSLLFLGDIMQHGSQITAAYDPITRKYDYTPCFQFVKPYFGSADLAIANLEVTLAGPPYSGYPQFSAPDELLTTLKDAGMDILVTANNHCVDKGKKGLERTITMLDSMKILHTGTFVDETDRLNDYPLIIEKNGFKLALLNYTFSTNGLPVTKPNIVNRIDTAIIHKDLIKAKTFRPDAIIVFTHWGIEYQSLPSGEQKMVTEFCFKNGTDLLIGAHPHVIQHMEWRKDKNQLIAYSLGNFVSGQRKRLTDGGTMLRVELEKIAYRSDSTTTNIDSAGYILQWIYKTTDSDKDYYIIPIPSFENNNTNFIRDSESKIAMKTFVSDSRSLYAAYNKNIKEITTVPFSTYYIKLIKSDGVKDETQLSEFGPIQSNVDIKGVQYILIGPYQNIKTANETLFKIKSKTSIKKYEVVAKTSN